MTCRDKIALVTGCTSGIGKATMCKLLNEGADVYMLVHRMKQGRKVAADTEGKYPGRVRKVIYFDCDKLETIESAIKEAYEDAGRIDIFINNAIGGASMAKDNLTVVETSHATCMGLMESILGVSAECVRVVIPLMIAGGGGSIVNVSSSTAVQPDVSRTYYGVAKAAVNMLTQQIAVQYGRQGIRCNAVLPGFTVSRATEKAMPEEFREAWLKHTLIRRLGTPEDQANAIVFLASDEASWITGHLMEVCGGYGLAANMYGDIVEPAVKKRGNENE